MLATGKFCHIGHFSRTFRTTTSIWKQPPQDRMRLKRHQPPPRHTVPFVDEAPLDFLPEKPTEISGTWGSTNDVVKALRFQHGMHLSAIPSTFEKLQELYHLEKNLWFHSLDLPLDSPEMLEFSQFITRTKLLSFQSEPQVHQSVTNYLNEALNEELLHLTRPPVNMYDERLDARAARNRQRLLMIGSCMEAVYQGLVTLEPHCQVAHLARQIDERATLETFLKRLYPKHVFESVSDLDADLFDEVNETVLDDESCVRYRIRAELAWQFRGPDPLQPFVSIDDPLCYEGEMVPCCYRPEAFDLKPVDCFQFSCLPHTQTLDSSEFARSVAGYWSSSPFWEGDPCEFGLLGVLDTMRAEQMRNDLNQTALSAETKMEILTRHGIAEGLLTAFTWTSAQAYNQGFTLYNELSYPFATQLVLFDGDHIQLLRYQLNSLASLWKADDCGAPFNLAWVSPRIRLFERLDDSNRIVANPDAVSLLVSGFLHPTESGRSSDSLRPYLAPGIAPRDRVQCKSNHSSIPSLIPNSTDSPDLDDSADIPEFVGDTAHISQAERETLEEARKGARKLPLQMFTPSRPHPNEVFFFKTTNKRDVIDELRAEVPSFGGVFGRLPSRYAAVVRKWRIEQRNRQPRLRVEQPPRRWR